MASQESSAGGQKIAGTSFGPEVSDRYKLIKPIGHGAYGVVISAEDCESRNKVAIKKISKAFDDLVDAKRILREIKLLRQLNHDNIIGILDILPPPSIDEFEDVYIVSDLMETDLHRIIYSRQPLSMDHVQYFVYQVLRALKYMHSANVLHRDLKPSNLLLNSNCDLKICDLGLARGIEQEGVKQDLTEYVVTRWYRAPEIMLACQEYTKAIDVWSVGCILAELIDRRPLFPGDDYIHQLQIICDKLGRPKEGDLGFVTSEKARRFIKGLPESQVKPMEQVFPKATGASLDLLVRMLQFNPSKRISVDEALAHPFMESLHSEEDEPEADFMFSFEFEKQELTKRRLQELMWEEIIHYHPDAGHNESGVSAATVSEGTQNQVGAGGNAPVAGEGEGTPASAATTRCTPGSSGSISRLVAGRKNNMSSGLGGKSAASRNCSHLGEEFGESPLQASKRQKTGGEADLLASSASALASAPDPAPNGKPSALRQAAQQHLLPKQNDEVPQAPAAAVGP